MPFEVGQVVTDAITLDWVIVKSVTEVPAARDLFGEEVPAHLRYRVEWPFGQWADRREDELR